ncbi:valine--tRNA ligase [bacterium]|nr:MAG: valine--tRNA ligase [bacterium]QQR62215.1 MAG: valine--tRNA ligase [bacterium]QQR63223.1 MAG: valine--tRNA ligase [bacterium]
MAMQKKYDTQATETQYAQEWCEQKIYHCDKNSFTLWAVDTPPPTVSGTLHIGHVFSYTQTDICVRYRRMQGHAVFYPFGFDDNGLPTERYVEKKCEVRSYTMKRSDFIALCLRESQEAAGQFKSLWQRLGISADWSNTYSTISDRSRYISQLSFLKLLQKDLVYRRYEPALYCTSCRTSVAQAELDDAVLPSTFNTIVFKTADEQQLLVATTRPELLPSCVALLFHPSDKRYAHLYKQQAKVPLFDIQVPILSDEKVDPEKGTGLVMVCTFGDTTDIEWYKKHHFSYIQSIGLDGKMTAQANQYQGLTVAAARQKIIQDLHEHGLLTEQKQITHAVSVHERCQMPVEYMLLAQWFVRILDYKKDFIALADKLDWKPTFMKARYVDWVEHLQWDWCVSRQRMYGIPFPVWHCQACQAIIPAEVKQLPVDPQELALAACPKCKSDNVLPDSDVMDTWNTSSLTPYIVKDLYQRMADPFSDHAAFLPMAMRPQAHDIIRTWAFDTIVKAFFHERKLPWKTIVISGHVLSEKNEKISKSKGNENKKPENLLKEFGADAVRYWTASATLGHDVAFSPDQIRQGSRLVTKLWNAFLFAEPHIQSVDPKKEMPEKGFINEWLLHELTLTEKRYHELMHSYEFGPALQQVEQFFWTIYCDNYIELVKHSLFNPDLYPAHQVDATRWTLAHVGLRLLQLYAPYIPFVTEAIFKDLYAARLELASLHQTEFAQYQTPYVFEKSASAGQLLVMLVSQVRKLKTQQQLSLKAPLARLLICVKSQEYVDLFQEHLTMLNGVTHAQEIKIYVENRLTDYHPSIGSSVISSESVLIEREGLWYMHVVV